MPAGLQIFNEQGSFQIDGVFKNLVLARKVTVSTEAYSDVGVVTSLATVTRNAGELLAIRSDVPIAHISTSSTAVRIRALAAAGAQVTCYFFSPIVSSDAKVGFQVFNEAGEIVYCASKKPLKFVGFPAGSGSFIYNSTTVYATILMNQYYAVSSDTAAVGGGRYFQRLSMERSYITNLTNGVKISQEFEYAYSATVSSPVGPPPPLPPNQASNTTGLHAVIDVTNY